MPCCTSFLNENCLKIKYININICVTILGKCAKNVEKNTPKHECARVGKLNLKSTEYV